MGYKSLPLQYDWCSKPKRDVELAWREGFLSRTLMCSEKRELGVGVPGFSRGFRVIEGGVEGLFLKCK